MLKIIARIGRIFAEIRRIWGAFLCGDILIVGVKK